MSQLTPTPTPTPRPDEVTHPNAVVGANDDARRGLSRSPAQWEAEALAMVEEADTRAGAAAGALRYAAARMFEDGVGDLAAAMDHLELALDEPPSATFRPVLRALRLHAVEAGSFWTAIDLLDVEAAAMGTAAERADLLVEKAELLEHRLLARDRARAVLEEALALVPGHRAALLALETTVSRGAAPADGASLEAVLRVRLKAATTGAERAQLLCRLALLAEADPARAVEALDLGMRALGESSGRGAAALARASIRRVAVHLGRDAELARAVELEADAAKGPERACWLALAAALARHRLGAGARAAALTEQALASDPDDPALLFAMVSSCLAAGEWTKARATLDHHAEITRDRDWAATLAGLSAHLAEQHESDDEAAAARYRRLLGTRAGDPVALAALERIASRTGDAAAQVTLAEGAVDRSAEGEERAALAMRAAELAETAAHDLPRAAALARRALEAVPGYAPAAHLLERVLPALGRWEEMIEVLEVAAGTIAAGERGAADAGAREAASRLERLGALYEDPLGDPGKALALYGEWAEIGTRRVAALRSLLRAAEKTGDALVAAEAALRLGTEIAELPPEVRFAWCYRAANIYEERAAADDEAIRAYEASALEVEAARIQAFRRGNLEDALAAAARALSFDPANVAAIAEHARLLARQNRGAELAAAYGALGQALADPADKAAAYRLQAEALEWQLAQPREALMVIERAHAAASGAKVAGAAAVNLARERLFERVGRGAEAAAAALERLSNGQATAAGDAVLGRRLDLAWRLTDPEAALRALRGAFDIAPGDGAVLDAALALALRLGRPRDAALAFEKLAEASGEGEAGAALWRAAAAERARASDGSREAQMETLALARRVIEAHATEESLAQLERLATRATDWPIVILARRKLAERGGDATTRGALLWELGHAHLAAGDLDGADADFVRATEADPTFLPALRALARLREARNDPRAAAEMYAREARLTKAPARAAAAFRQAARLYANQVRDDAMAARCLEEVLALEPEAETDFEVLEVILRARSDFDRLAQVMRRRATAGPLPKRRDRLLSLAELIYARDPTDAAAVLAEAVSLDPTSVMALVRLAEVETELGRSAEAIATFRLAIAASADPKVGSAAWVRIGDIAERALADSAQAVDAYRNALVSAPDDIGALTGLARGLGRQRNFADAAITLRRLATVETDRDARVGHLTALGELLAGPAEDPEGAADAFEQALGLHPDGDVAMDRLDALLTELDDPGRLAAALTRYLEVSPLASGRRMRLAALWSGPLGSNERAIEELRVVVSGSESDVAARAELARVLERADRLPEAITEHLALLRLEPLLIDSLRGLKRLCERSGQRRRSLRAAGALVALGQADDAENRLVREARLRWVPEATGGLSGAEFDAYVRHPDERHPATALLAAMIEVLPRLYRLSLDDWGVSKQDRVPARSDDPLRALVTRIALLFGLGEGYEVYQARAVATQVEMEVGPPPALLLPPGFAALPRQEGCRQLGQQLGQLRAGIYGIGRIPGKDLGLLVAAGVRTVYPDYGRGILPEAELNEVAQKISRSLPRRHRRAFEQAALSFRDGGIFNGEKWRAGLLHTGHRAALVASGDVLGAFEQIARADRRLAGAVVGPSEERLAAARANPEIVEMIGFAVGDELAALNTRFGLD